MDAEQLTKQKLKESGLRVTPQRVLILQTIISPGQHLTAEEIHRQLPSFITLATVYNNLRSFVNLGIINELSFGNGSSKYEVAGEKHYHVICESCHKIVDFNYPRLIEVESAASRLTDYVVDHHTLEFYGLCNECRNKS
ncbi:Fur family transcriptional regulator [Fictibacillus sp. CENA-BCM004]|uniref:Fur family transcriptional regulator n=1 Tax=Fictibacillus terranigra TaxID=3058424 RepID=A0ABT8E3E9_9BACL|nr:Fur family transcriptional regulator [Fictibacillus sp. CENA-BCM004]MDN4072442.1 Fur family transcriptional regulator [Fictibacillus sp. CENA-BCM004]